MPDKNFQFVELTMAVILGSLLLATPPLIVEDVAWSNFRAVLLIISLLNFTEMYIVLVRYHKQLNVTYNTVYMFIDLVIGFAYVLFVEFMIAKDKNPVVGIDTKNVDYAMIIGIWIFFLLLARQLIVFLRIDDINAAIKTANINKSTIFAPMVADAAAIIISGFIYLSAISADRSFWGIGIVVWAWIGLIFTGIYFGFAYVVDLKK